jgi:hypothetical protein
LNILIHQKIFIRINTKSFTAVVNTVIDELTEKGYVRINNNRTINLSSKGYSYLELEGLVKMAKQKRIIAIKKQPIIIRISKISLAEWGVLATILATIIAIWIYVLEPLLSSHTH